MELTAAGKVFGPAFNWAPGPNPEWLAALTAEAGDESARFVQYSKYRDYYDGQHATMLPSQSDKLKAYTGFRANLCEVVIDAFVERLAVTGFTGTGKGAKEAAAWCDELWQSERLDDVEADVYHDAALTGDGFIIVDWDNDLARPRICYNPSELISVGYSDAGHRRIAWASKRWTDPGRKLRFLNRYYPDRVERYSSTIQKDSKYAEAGWKPYDPGDGFGPVVSWVAPDGSPLGVPVIPFRNKARGARYGRSELANVIPLQDSINKTLIDLLLVLDYMGWPQRWVRGNEPPGGWQTAPGRVWQSNHPNFEAGELSSADPTGLLASLARLIKTASGLSRTPQHLFHIDGDFPSGEALKTAEAPLIGKARDRFRSFGNSWEDAFSLCLKLDNAFGDGRWNTDAITLQTQWRDPELRNDLAHAQAVTTKAPYLSPQQILRELGYGAAEIKIIMAEKEAAEKKKAQVGGALLDAFRTGGQMVDDEAEEQDEPGKQQFTRNPDR